MSSKRRASKRHPPSTKRKGNGAHPERTDRLVTDIPQNPATVAEATFQGIGRFVYAFSQLESQLRDALGRRLNLQLWEITLMTGASSAEPLVSSYFALCRMGDVADENERRILTKLEDEIKDHIQYRNDVVHGTWDILTGGEGGEPEAVARLWRTKPGSRTNAQIITNVTPGELNAKSERLLAIRGFVYEIAPIVFRNDALYDGKRLANFYSLVGRRVERDGPDALWPLFPMG